jgi:hypothetical protein
MGNFSAFIPNVAKPYIKGVTGLIEAPNMAEADEYVEKSNKELLITAAKFIGGFVVAGFALIMFISNKYNIPLYDILIHNIIILVFVALTEYCFLTFIAQNYITADPNFVKLAVVKELKKYAEN